MYLEKLSCRLQRFFLQGPNGGKMETTSRQALSGFQNTPALHERAKTYSALSFDRITFSTWRICFHFLGKTLLNALVFVSQ